MHPILLEVTFTLEKRDFRRAAQLYTLRNLGRPLRNLGISSLFILPFLIYFAVTHASGGLGLYFLAGVLVLAKLGILLAAVQAGRHASRRGAGGGVPITWRFNEEGMQAFSGATEDTCNWDKLTGYLEIDDYFLLFLHPQVFNIIPKRAFPSADEMAELRRLLRSKFAERKVQ